MSMRPTAEQVAEARAWLQRVAEFPSALPDAVTHARTIQALLAETEPPTDEELAEEVAAIRGVARRFVEAEDADMWWYRYGACRKGRR